MTRSPLYCSLIAASILAVPTVHAQSVFGTNLIVNGDAESGAGGNGSKPASTIPGWTINNAADVLTYASTYGLTTGDVVPIGIGKNYFAGGRNASSSISQNVSLASGASTIDAGSVTFAVSGYLGGYSQDEGYVQMAVAFQDASGKQLSSVTVGPVKMTDRSNTDSGLYLRRAIGPVPTGTRTAAVVVTFTGVSGESYNDGFADNLSLVLNAAATPQSLLGKNLIVNGDGEAGLPIPSTLGVAVDVPGWVRSANFTTDAYVGGLGDLDSTTPNPPDAGHLYFYGGSSSELSSAYQDIDISSAAGPIDAGQIKYDLSAWIGGYADQNDNCTLTLQFMNWSGGVLSSVKLGPVLAADRNQLSALLKRTASGAVPAGARMVHVSMTMTRTDGEDNDGVADSLSLILSSGAGIPSISANGVVSAAAFGGFKSIAPGSWIEIYGQNLAPDARDWTGAFTGSTAPTSLDGVKVSIGDQPAYVSYISAGQVNVQVPSSVGTGQQNIVVSSASGTSAPYPVTVNATQPGLIAPASFLIGGKQYAAALFSNGSTFAIPAGAVPGVDSRPAVPGETIVLYGVGFGPTSPNFPAGQLVSQGNNLAMPITMTFDGTSATLAYMGLAPGLVGVYQFNAIVPKIANNAAAKLVFTLGGAPGSQTLYMAVQQQ